MLRPVLRMRHSCYPTEYAEYMRIFEQSREVARFSPTQGSSRRGAANLQGASLTRLIAAARKGVGIAAWMVLG